MCHGNIPVKDVAALKFKGNFPLRSQVERSSTAPLVNIVFNLMIQAQFPTATSSTPFSRTIKKGLLQLLLQLLAVEEMRLETISLKVGVELHDTPQPP